MALRLNVLPEVGVLRLLVDVDVDDLHEDDDTVLLRRVSCAGVREAFFFSSDGLSLEGPGVGDRWSALPVAWEDWSFLPADWEDWSVLGDASFLVSFSRRSAGGVLLWKYLSRFLRRPGRTLSTTGTGSDDVLVVFFAGDAVVSADVDAAGTWTGFLGFFAASVIFSCRSVGEGAEFNM